MTMTMVTAVTAKTMEMTQVMIWTWVSTVGEEGWGIFGGVLYYYSSTLQLSVLALQ